MALYVVMVVVITFSMVEVEMAENVTMQEMPLSFFKSSNLYDAYSGDKSVITKMYLNEVEGDTNGFDKSGNKKSQLRSEVNVVDEEHAGCSPYSQVFELPNNRPNVKLYPSCILLKQCGGCCGHSSLQCTPTSTKAKKIKVVEFVYDGVKPSPEQSAVYMDVVEHLECECQCKTMESDCNSTIHNYDSFDCQCTCKHGAQACPNNKRWNESTCSCQCTQQTQNCGTGYFYNTDTCRCEAEGIERSAAVDNIKPTKKSAAAPTFAVKPAAATKAPKSACSNYKCPRRYIPVMSEITKTCNCQYSRGK